MPNTLPNSISKQVLSHTLVFGPDQFRSVVILSHIAPVGELTKSIFCLFGYDPAYQTQGVNDNLFLLAMSNDS